MENTIIGLFDEQVAAAPDAACVLDGSRRLTRRQFSSLVDTIGAMIPPDAKRVGVVMDHSVEMIAAIFAVLKRGCAYVPAEPSFPSDRILFMMQDAGVDVVLIDGASDVGRAGADRVDASQSSAGRNEASRGSAYRDDASQGNASRSGADHGKIGRNNVDRSDAVRSGASSSDRKAQRPSAVAIKRGIKATGASFENKAQPQDAAYILYTSGSTGTPKGVSVRNENVCHYVRAFQNEFKPTCNDVMLQYSVCSFDIFVEEVFATLCSGAVLAIPPEKDRQDVPSLMNFVERQGVTIISGFPYLLMEMNALPSIPKSLRLLISGGDVLRAAYVDNLLDQAEVYNTYGPSETTVCASYFRCNGTCPLPDGTYPVGKEVKGASVAILDDCLSPVTQGEVGEICISGGGVSSGYVGDRKEENKAFVARNGKGVLYRSGDLGYVLPDGNIAFLHRKDTQVMIGGKRVEPAEVESVLCDCPEVKAACVRPYVDEKSLSYLVAYVVPSHDQTQTCLSALKKDMARFLPDYMIPEFFVQLKEMPLTAHGKIDTAALPVILKEGKAA